jgi:predicted outer membrane repeat protein
VSFDPGGICNLDDCLFAGNTAGGSGGALRSSSVFSNGTCPMLITNCTFAANSAADDGGAYYGDQGADIKIINSVLWSNSAPTGSQLSLELISSPGVKVEYCDVQGGQAGVQVWSGTLNWAGGNITLDPLFADADGPDGNPATFADNDWRLAAGSPCIDAGRNGVIQFDLTDIDGDGDFDEKVPFDLDLGLRRYDDPAVLDTGLGNAPLIDLGAYEHHP